MLEIELTHPQTPEPFPHNFNKVIGSGHLGLALYERTLRHLEMAHRELGVQYLRCHGLLSGSPDLCSWADQNQPHVNPELGFVKDQLVGQGKILHNFAFIDLIIDRLLDIGIRPFVEVGFMPRLLASSNHTLMRWDAYTSPPRDYKLWSELIDSLIRHWLKRYGLKEISQWYYEVWNEPNLDGFWPASMEEYYKLYDSTVRAIKAVNPELRVGGPSTAGRVDALIDPFLNYCHANKTPVDFVTSHSYAVQTGERKGEFAYHTLRPASFLAQRFGQMRKEIDNSPIPGLPLHITEYNSTTSTHGIIHDLPFNAAFLAQTLSEAGQHADSFSYWAVSDIFVEEGIAPAEFHGGFGMVNIHDIPKPTYHLFSFFNQLGNKVLSRDDRYLFTRRDDGHTLGVLWNPNDNARPSQRVEYRITLPPDTGPCVARTMLVDEQHANPYRTWELLGRERNPSRAQVELLRESSRPVCSYTAPSTEAGRPHLDVTLDKNAIILVDFIPVEDQTHGYHGLDKARYESLSLPGN
ncbi:MAG: xylan 1,4-beta-xylosidase [Phycisphaera sp.]|nr:xylan 1,4-beta-xylosidase [Phycisphaera sp.]